MLVVPVLPVELKDTAKEECKVQMVNQGIKVGKDYKAPMGMKGDKCLTTLISIPMGVTHN